MSALGRFSTFLLLSFVSICACRAGTQASTPLTTINASQGGKIVYGTVDGATTQATAMSKILNIVQNNCGEKPQIGKVFQFKGTKTVGVFFSVTNHPGGNKKVAGLVLSAASGPRQVEAALLSDDASRFGKTVNPMLQQLLNVWHPGGTAADSSSSSGSAPSTGIKPGLPPAAKLHTVTASDNSVSVGIPDGWQLDPTSAGGALLIKGPQGEFVGLNLTRMAIDPSNPRQRQYMSRGIGSAQPGIIYYPFHGDLTRDFPALFKEWRHAGGAPPVQLKVDKIDPMSAPQGEHCVHAFSHLNPGAKDATAMNTMMCAFDPGQSGYYMLVLNNALIPEALDDREHNTIVAIVASFKLNMQVINQQKAANDAQIARNTKQAIDNIHQIGAQATARYNATQASNDAQHASYWAQQNNNAAQHANWNAGQDAQARTSQGFHNYILDQTVVQDNNMYNNGTIGHGTLWNSTADALVKADPDRFEYVDKPNFWQGTDYHQ